MKKKALSIFMILFFTLITVKHGYPCSGAAHIDENKTIVWINYDRSEVSEASFEDISPFGIRIMGFGWRKSKPGGMPHISQGINKHSLAIITFSAPDDSAVASARDWLMKFKTVDEALRTIEGKPSYLSFRQFKILADQRKVALIEGYSPKEYKIIVLENGYLSHTNHYTFPELSHYNAKLAKNPKQIEFSETRLKIVDHFLNAIPDKTVDSFKKLSALKDICRKTTIASIVFVILHNDEKPRIIYRLPQSQSNTDWREVGF